MPIQSQAKPLGFTAPLDWPELLAFFRIRAVPGLELVDAHTYSRRFDVGGKSRKISIRCSATESTLEIDGLTPKQATGVYPQIRKLFDLDAEPRTIAAALGKTQALRAALPNLSSIRVPGSWNLFEIGVRAILGQQVTVIGARTLTQRLMKRFGNPPLDTVPTTLGLSHFPKPSQLINAPIVELGMPGKRAEAIRLFARLMAQLPKLPESPTEFTKELLAIPGIGPWTVNYIRMRGLKDPDAFPEGDIALLRAAQHLQIAQTMKELVRVADQWRPYRAYATLALWKVLSKRTKS